MFVKSALALRILGLIKNSIMENVLPTSFGSTLEDFFKVNEDAQMNQREQERSELHPTRTLWGICPLHRFASIQTAWTNLLFLQQALHI